MPDVASLQSEVDRFTQIAGRWNNAIIVLMFLAAISAAGLFVAQKMAFKYSDKAAYAAGQLALLKESIEDGKLAVLQKAASEANEKAANAQIELARLTGPPYLVPVIHGTATPDLSKGTKQLVLLTANTRINLPTLPNGKSLTWTLILAQDQQGQHQFTFSPQISGFGNTLFSPGRSKWLVNLLTDSNGTVNVGLGGTYAPPPDTHP